MRSTPRVLAVAAPLLLAAGAAAAQSSNQIVVDGSTTVGPIAKAFAEYYMQSNPGVNITVSESGSGNGAKALINGTCQVADMSRFMKDTEFSAAVEKGVLPVAHVVAMDGIAVIVHPSNPVKEISTAQVADIYMGKITNWSQLGGPNKEIVVVSRDTNSGTYESFESLVLRGQKMFEKVEYLGSNGAIRQKIQSTATAVGYVGLGFADPSVRTLVVDGVMCDRQTVTSGTYPIARPLYMFTNGFPQLGSHVHRFVTLHLTRKGQEIIESIGFVPVTSY